MGHSSIYSYVLSNAMLITVTDYLAPLRYTLDSDFISLDALQQIWVERIFFVAWVSPVGALGAITCLSHNLNRVAD